MAVTRDELEAFLSRLGIETTTVAHQPLHTVAESRALRGEIPGAHTKNLFLKDKKGASYLVVAEEETRIDLKQLHKRIGAAGRLSFGSAERLFDALGVEPGSVTPFGLINDDPPTVTVIIDDALAARDRINCHPLANTATTTISSDDLMTFLRATGHEPRIIALAPLSAE